MSGLSADRLELVDSLTPVLSELSPAPTPRRARRKPRPPSRRLPQRVVWPSDDVRGPVLPQPSSDTAITPERAAELRAMPYADYLKTPEWDARRLGKILAAGGKVPGLQLAPEPRGAPPDV